MPDDPSNGIIRFGSFEVSPRGGELRRNGSKIKLQEQPFQVLTLLLAKPGEVVTREELRDKLWPANTFVDFDHGLNAAVKRLRDALGDSAENPRFIETLARRGYRFIAPVVNEGAGTSAAATSPADPTVTCPFIRRHWTRVGAALSVLAIATSAGWVAARRFNPRVHMVEQRLTANPPSDPVLSATVSPDTRYLAYADSAGLFVRITQTGETHRVVLHEGFKVRPTSWFPDSSHMLVTLVQDPGAKWEGEKASLWNASVFGGAPRKLMDSAGHGVVSSDGAQIIFLRMVSMFPQIWWMRADGQEARKLLSEPQHSYHSLAWAPSGRRFAFLDQIFHPMYGGGTASLRIYDLGSGKTSDVLSSPRIGPGLAWTPDDRLIYSQRELPPNQADSNLWAQKIDPATDKPMGESVRLTNGPDAKTDMSISGDGKRLTFLRRSSDADIFVGELSAADDRFIAIERLHLEEHRQLPLAWTPDNKSVMFISDRDGPFHLFKQSTDQVTPDLVLGGDSSISVVRPNPDYSAILVVVLPKKQDGAEPSRIEEIPFSGGNPRFILADRDIHNFQCARAPSSVCVYSRDAVGRMQFYSFDLATGKKTPLPKLSGAEWQNWTLSPDGTMLALANWRHEEHDPTIELLRLQGGPARVLTVHNAFRISSIDFAADGRGIWTVVQEASGARALLNVELSGRVKPVFQENQNVLGWAIPSPDGHRLAFWEASGSANAWLLQGF